MIKGADMDNLDTGATLRDTLSDAFDSHVEAPVDAPDKAADAPVVEAPEDKPEGRTAGRKRDESGRLLPGKADKPEPAAAAPTAPVEPPKPRPAYPSTWKKDFQGHWEKIPPEVAEEIARREGDYAKGVSTYKGEYDRVKPVDEALKPYAPFLQQANMKPEQYVSALANIDHQLRYGTPAQKLKTVADLIHSNQIPIHELFEQREDGKVYFSQQYAQQQQSNAQPQGLSMQDVQRLVQQQVQQVQIQTAWNSFVEAKDGSGNPLHPHAKVMEKTIDGLLRAGLAHDIQSAHDAALAMPQHKDLFDAQQKQLRDTEQASQAKAKADAAARARAAAVSPRSSAPTGTLQKENKGSKSLRETIEEQFDAVESGRV